jgi:ABC-2 type transport system permease protein
MPLIRPQLAALARVRWRIFVNSLRTTAGAFELLSRIIIALVVAVAGIGGAAGFAAGGWFFVSQPRALWLALLLWPIFIFWQVFPIVSTAFSENLDASSLLRFPLSYRAYFLVRVTYGSLDIATALGCMWLSGVTVGIGLARPALFPWTALVMLCFAASNILLARMIFAWVDRWLAQRRTREIMGILMFLLILGLQFIGPLAERLSGSHPAPGLLRLRDEISPVQRFLPPGLAAEAVAGMLQGRAFAAVAAVACMGAYAVLFLWLLDLRLRAQYRGENLSQVEVASVRSPERRVRSISWRLPLLSAPVAAMLEKELRYFLRSGPMLLTMVMPAFMLVIFRSGILRPGRQGTTFGSFHSAPDLAFPIGAVYTLLMITNIVFNSLGGDGGGVQLFFTAPVTLRRVILGKNLAQISALAFSTLMVWLATGLLYAAPSLPVLCATLAWMLFSLPLNLAAGNLFSVYAPKKIEYAVFGRQRPAQSTVLVAFLLQLVIFAVGVLVEWQARVYGSLWLATLAFLTLAALAWGAYAIILSRMDSIALARRESLIGELSRSTGWQSS